MSTSPLSEDEVKKILFRNAPPEYENIIRNSTDLYFVQLQEKMDEWMQRVNSDLPRRFGELGYELPWPDEINNDERALEIFHLHRNEFYPEGIQLINQIAPYYNKPEFVFSQAPENGITYSTEQLQYWYGSIFVPYGSFLEEYLVLLDEWRGMVFDVANAQANADMAAMELEMAHHYLQMNAASLQEQERHNLAMESAESLQTPQHPQAKKSGLGVSILKGAGKLLGANYRWAQGQQNKPNTYYCTKCKRLQNFSHPGIHTCCGKSMVPK